MSVNTLIGNRINRKLSSQTRLGLLNKISSFFELHELTSSPLFESSKKSIFKKLHSRTRDPLLRDKALTTFRETEVCCSNTNRRLIQNYVTTKTSSSDAVLLIAQRKIASILGKFSIEEMLDRGRFGPGSTYECKGADVSRERKFSLRDVTFEFNNIARGLLAEYPLWATALTDSDLPVCPMLTPVPGGRYSTALKDAKTDRSIIIEPTINSWFQQALGLMIRDRMKRRCAVDLNDSSLNRRLAHYGSLSDDLATVDLSSASDLISTALVHELLPPDWTFWLNITRSRRVLIDGVWVELEKFSSMGNGFTFDLESLIFYALTWAVTVHQGYNPFWVNVFGDDIICPSGVEQDLKDLFIHCGFRINVEKSFFRGPFRESCGEDYYLGKNIRGVYIKTLEDTIDLIKVHNRLYAWATRNGISWDPLRREILTHLTHVKARTPSCLGDLGITSSFDEVCPSLAGDQFESFLITCLKPRLLKKETQSRELLLERILGSEFARNHVPLRLDPVGYRYIQTISEWSMDESQS